MSNTDLLARLAKLEADNAAKDAQIAELAAKSEAKRNAPLTLKVTDKGAVGVYGLQRFPVTLYSQQWVKLLGHADAIRAFIEANKATLSVKADKAPEAPVAAPAQ
jgi:hypothetical protein